MTVCNKYGVVAAATTPVVQNGGPLCDDCPNAMAPSCMDAVSFKHLTPPTNELGENSVGPRTIKKKIQTR